MESVTELIGPGGKRVDLSRVIPSQRLSVDMVDSAPDFVPIYLQALPYTMTSAQNMFALYSAVKFIAESGVPGDIVECGVWAGGSCMIAALTLQSLNKLPARKIWLYDTFTGMVRPTDVDQPIGVGRTVIQHQPIDLWHEGRIDDQLNTWCFASQEDVRRNLNITRYPAEQTVFVKGKVEDTIPGRIPEVISCLRLDTDWYESTYHELTHLYPLLSPGGVLILDDYGFWEGQKKAVDQYFQENAINLLLHRVDTNARMAIKTQ